jgi:addiction module RelE/StbE family toxin
MSARYTRDAINDLDQISSYLAKHDPAVAGALLDAVELVAARLARFPRSAQETETRGVRAAPVQRYPYIVFYTVEGRDVTIHYVRHAARLRPWDER